MEIEYFRINETRGVGYMLLVNHTLKIYVKLESKYKNNDYIAKCLGVNIADIKRFENLQAFKKIYKNYK